MWIIDSSGKEFPCNSTAIKIRKEDLKEPRIFQLIRIRALSDIWMSKQVF